MSMKVFLVDDEPINNKINKKVLQLLQPEGDYKDYTDPQEAYTALPGEQPDLIFLDLNMPGMSGWEFLDKMNQDGFGTQVIILTSSISTQDRDKAATYGNVIEFMSKPVNKALLGKYIS